MVAIGGVLCCGNVVFDIPVYAVEDIDWDQTRWVDTIGESIGGNGANTSFVLARMGVPVGLMSLVGSDERGRKLVAILSAAGVDTSEIGSVEGFPTAATCVLVREGGARKFYHRPGASRELDPDSLEFSREGFTHFHLANPFSMGRLRPRCGEVMRRAKEAGLTTSIDTGWDSLGRWLEDIGPALPYTDIFFANEAEAKMLGGVQNLRDGGARHVVIKTGPGGCVVDGVPVPGFRVRAVDSTGAGDCFSGAFLAGLARGMCVAEAARLANAVGAMNVEQLGATTGIRDFAGTLDWMSAHQQS